MLVVLETRIFSSELDESANFWHDFLELDSPIRLIPDESI